jgi:CRISPR type III-B/RAMP module-associated protein Cmr3
MSKTALVTFTPLEPYFLGGETTHGNGRERNYFSKSNPYPQQTTLCGTLRHLLCKNDLEFGQHSFTPNDPKLTEYGELLGISPLFLKNPSGKYFLRQALDRNPGKSALTLETTGANAEVLLDNGDLDFPKNWKPASRWTGFEPKEKLANEWVSDDGKTSVKPEDIFKTFNRPGIPKQEIRNPKPDAPGLFKQDLVRLEKDWAFCVLAELSDQVDLDKIKGQNFQLGGEKSIFHIELAETSQKFEQMFSAEKMFYQGHPPSQPRLVLTADAWVPTSAWEHTIGAVTETTDFRHIRTHRDVRKFGRMRQASPKHTDHTPTEQMAKSTKYILLTRGSVFVCADKKALDNLSNTLRIQPWYGIGFNQFITFCP